MGLPERYGRRTIGTLFAWMILLQTWFPSGVFGAPVLRCEIHYGGEIISEDFQPGVDPYAVQPREIYERFLFKAVVIGNEKNLEYIKIYTYYKEQNQVILLHEVKYLPPFRQSEPSSATLTGVNYLYAPVLERELQYECRLLDGSSY